MCIIVLNDVLYVNGMLPTAAPPLLQSLVGFFFNLEKQDISLFSAAKQKLL